MTAFFISGCLQQRASEGQQQGFHPNRWDGFGGRLQHSTSNTMRRQGWTTQGHNVADCGQTDKQTEGWCYQDDKQTELLCQHFLNVKVFVDTLLPDASVAVGRKQHLSSCRTEFWFGCSCLTVRTWSHEAWIHGWTIFPNIYKWQTSNPKTCCHLYFIAVMIFWIIILQSFIFECSNYCTPPDVQREANLAAGSSDCGGPSQAELQECCHFSQAWIHRQVPSSGTLAAFESNCCSRGRWELDQSWSKPSEKPCLARLEECCLANISPHELSCLGPSLEACRVFPLFLTVYFRYLFFYLEIHVDACLHVSAWTFGAVVAVFDVKVLVLMLLRISSCPNTTRLNFRWDRINSLQTRSLLGSCLQPYSGSSANEHPWRHG